MTSTQLRSSPRLSIAHYNESLLRISPVGSAVFSRAVGRFGGHPATTDALDNTSYHPFVRVLQLS